MEIEHLRSEMNNLAATGASPEKVLEVSQRLDDLIVQYYKGGDTLTNKIEREP